MYFLVIMAFALVLSENLPPQQSNLFSGLPLTGAASLFGTLAIVLAQLPVVWAVARWARRKTLARLDGTLEGHDAAADAFAYWQQAMLFVLGGFLVVSMLLTPWPVLIRDGWGLGRIPLFGDLLLLAPFFAALTIKWTIFYPAEMQLRELSLSDDSDLPTESMSRTSDPSPAYAARQTVEPFSSSTNPKNAAASALRSAKRQRSQHDITLREYLIEKFRHQVLLLAVPMSIIVFAKDVIYVYGPSVVPLPRDEGIRAMILSTALGTVSVCVLVLAPLMLRYIWATEPLPAGPLRDRFVATCRRIGLRYREILLWHTHGMAVNAAVMGFIAPLRYILVSDALLETMNEDEIEAVFGHEAGHVRHWHLPFFGLFAIVSMYIAGGVMHLLFFADRNIDPGLLQLVALMVLLAMWLFGFSWLSRRFERQADLYGVRCITPDMKDCPTWCPVHGQGAQAGLCVSAANLFGRTLGKIADLNGIPRDAPSWRHGSIESRCKQIEVISTDAPALARFDRRLLQIKISLMAMAVIGSVIAVWLYYPYVADALGRR